ncbi:hypothetical protein QTO34_014749 [Cnephaeus nilssonii]|uniref:Uncharacterized protein n=1 Tax=Cnephaeus nilssonii TaxID=3371016 RepID=A0AA40I750_CNENI|nr:hypothetical protein QTO34_014749 [Eptesicus nilssonii]
MTAVRKKGPLYIWPAPVAIREWPLSLLADRKCLLHSCDTENRTGLMKGIRCRKRNGQLCVGIDSNTAPHCAVTGENTAMVAKLLSHKANTEAGTRMTSDHFHLL